MPGTKQASKQPPRKQASLGPTSFNGCSLNKLYPGITTGTGPLKQQLPGPYL